MINLADHHLLEQAGCKLGEELMLTTQLGLGSWDLGRTSDDTSFVKEVVERSHSPPKASTEAQ